ncbi:MAG: peptidase M17 [Bacteroidetes bacterium 4572_117]|nr:MAG: peptidase M17 [Bacteroidetes bacterium 4572_117]
MSININKRVSVKENEALLILTDSPDKIEGFQLADNELNYVKRAYEKKEKLIPVNQYNRWVFIQFLPTKDNKNENREELRRLAVKLKPYLNTNKIEEIQIVGTTNNKQLQLDYAEGLALSHYQFLKYFEKKEEKKNSLKSIYIVNNDLKTGEINELSVIIESVYGARTLVNEPLSFLDTEQMVIEVKNLSKQSGFKLEVLEKRQIESLKMGGLLAVNQGSKIPPRFMILSWEPENAENKKPIVLVGKGIVYDTGGYSLKPTANSMDQMKSDMGGAATVAATLAAISKAKLPVKVIGLIPVTDNAIGPNAYVPGDVITMHNGKTVEVLNTDAEGRLILADALSYAKKYEPELVFDLATLTGAAAYAIGYYGIVAMGTANEKIFGKLTNSGESTCERIVRFPFWDDYKELLKSNIADLKNIGGRVAGAITAGKFLEYFTDYQWIHLDIAGPSYVEKDIHYLTTGGTGAGTRLLFDFLKNY